MIKDFLWEYKWIIFSIVSVVGFVVLYIAFGSEDSWKKFSGWLVKKKKKMLKEKVKRKKEKINKKKDKVDNIDEKIKKIEEENKKIEKANNNKDLNELSESFKNKGY